MSHVNAPFGDYEPVLGCRNGFIQQFMKDAETDLSLLSNSETERCSPHTLNTEPSNHPASPFSEDEMVQLSNTWFQDEELNLQFPLLLDELMGATPVVAETVQELSNGVWKVHSTLSPSNRSTYITTSPGRAQPVLENVQPVPAILDDDAAITRTGASFSVEFRQRRYEFLCHYCGKVYDRINRARDCQYQDRKLTPYLCTGRCGNGECDAEYSSGERLDRHISASRIQCPQCQKEVSKQNMARHRKSHCPNRGPRKHGRGAKRSTKKISMATVYP